MQEWQAQLAAYRSQDWSPLSLGDLAAWYDASAAGAALQDGAAQFTAGCKHYLSVASNASLQTGDIDFEVGCWVYLDSVATGGVNAICSKSELSSRREFCLDQTSSQFRFRVWSGGATQIGIVSTSMSLAIQTWYFIRAWHDSVANTVNIQVNNGTPVNSATTGSGATSTAPLAVGRNPDVPSDYFSGRIDSPYFTKTISSTAEATALYNAGAGRTYADLTAANGLDTFAANLTSWWDLGEACYSADTEILTADGWKFFSDLSDDDTVATLNQEGYMSYEKPYDRQRYEYTGKMFHQTAQGIDIQVTPNHRMLVRRDKTDQRLRKTTGADSVTLDKFELIAAKDLPKRVIYKKNMQWQGEEQEFFTLPAVEETFPVTQRMRAGRTKAAHALNLKRWGYKEGNLKKNPERPKPQKDTYTIIRPEKRIPMDIWLRFFGIWLAEGYAATNNRYRIGICQSITANPEKCKIIEDWLMELGYNFCYSGSAFEIQDKQLWTYLRQFGKSGDKFIPKELKALSPRQLWILLEAMLLGDGNFRRDTKIGRSWEYASNSKRLADDTHELAIKCGWTGTIGQAKCKNRKRVLNGNISYRVKISTSSPLRGVNVRGSDRSEWVDYTGFVYDVSVKNHTLYVRRNGCACWSTNSSTRYDSKGTNHLAETFDDIISPTVLNGGFETLGAGGDDVFAVWTESKASGTIAAEGTAVYAGTYACRMDVDAGASLLRLRQAALLVTGRRYYLAMYAKASDATGNPTIYYEIGGVSAAATTALTTSYALKEATAVADGTALNIERGANCASKSIYIDNVTLRSAEIPRAAGIGQKACADTEYVAKLLDQSGYGRHLTQTDFTKRLQYRTNQQNGLPAIVGVGGDDSLQSALDLIGTGAVTVFSAFKAAGWGGGYNGELVDNNKFIVAGLITGSGRMMLTSNNSTLAYSANASIVLGTPYAIAVTRQSTLINTYINGVLSGGSDLNGGTPVAASPTCIGNGLAGNRGFNGNIYELGIYTRILTESEISRLTTYLRQKWNI